MRPRRGEGLLGPWDPGRPPRLDFHMHTTWTDGRDDPPAMLRAARRAGLSAILFSEHARATSAPWFLAFAAQIRSLPEQPCRAYVGAEVKILDLYGSLDATPVILDACDLVVGVVHSFPGESMMGQDALQPGPLPDPEEAMRLEYRLTLALAGNPRVDILGHPFGMTVRRFGLPLPLDLLHQVARRAADAGVAMEYNAKYHAAPRDVLDVYASAGVLVSIGSDAHCAEEVGRAARTLEQRRATP